jgi:hypothetical protein
MVQVVNPVKVAELDSEFGRIIHVAEVLALYRTWYLVAPGTAVQVTVAVVEVSTVAEKPALGGLHCACKLLELKPMKNTSKSRRNVKFFIFSKKNFVVWPPQCHFCG